MSEHVTGREARELLELPDNAASWKIEQRNLAEKVAWLYGREADELHGDHTVTWKPGPSYAGFEVDACKEPGEKVQLSVTSLNRGDWVTIYADEAVELARALLAAAEEARRG